MRIVPPADNGSDERREGYFSSIKKSTPEFLVVELGGDQA
jgi:hypothetical protein